MRFYCLAEKVGMYLAAAPELRELSCSIYAGVRIKDIMSGGTALRGSEVVDLVVCEGNRVLLGITADAETAMGLANRVGGLSFIPLPKADIALPLGGDDEDWLEYPSNACLEAFLEQVLSILAHAQRKYRPPSAARRSLASCREKKPAKVHVLGQDGYTLPTVPPEQIIHPDATGARRLYERMAEKCLLRPDFTPSHYGFAHGLLLRYQTTPFGDVAAELLAAPGAAQELSQALFWSPGQFPSGKLPLAERLKQINSLPAGHSGAEAAVKALLDTPVDALFPHPEKLQALLREQTAEKVPTYGEVICVIRSLRQEFGDDPMLDDDRSQQMRRTCEKLLLALSEGFLTKMEAAVRLKDTSEKRPLKARLATVQESAGVRVFDIPLVDYVQAVCRLSQCGYPDWVYQTRFKPIIDDSPKSEREFSFRFFVAYCKVCRDDNGLHDWTEAFPLLFDLVTMPVCGK